MRIRTLMLANVVVLALVAAASAWAFAGGASSPALKPNVKVIVEKVSVSNGGVANATVTCPKGLRIFSGGYASTGQFAQITVAAPALTSNSFILSAWMPPTNINVPVLKETARISVAAWCAPAGQPVVLGSP